MTAAPDRWQPVDGSTLLPGTVVWVWGPDMTVDGLHCETPHRASRGVVGWWSDEDREANGSEKAVEGVTHWRPYLVPDPPATGVKAAIVLACGHRWYSEEDEDEDIESARQFARLCAATGNTALCDECGEPQLITDEVVVLNPGEVPAPRGTPDGQPWVTTDLNGTLADLHRILNALSATLATRDPATLPPPHQRVKPQGGSGWFATGGVIWHPIDRWRVIVPVDGGPDHMVFVADPFQTFPGDAIAMHANEARALGQALMAAADWATNDLWRASFATGANRD